MAVRFDADTDWISLAINIGGAGHVNFALGAWLYLEEFNDSAGVIAAGHLSNGRTLGLGCDTNFPTPRLCLGDSQTGFTSGAFGTQPSLNGWIYAEFSSPNTTGGTVTARYSPAGSSTVYTVTRTNGVESSVQAQVVHINRFAVGNANGFTGGLRAAYFRGYSGPTADDATFLAHKAATTGAGTLFFCPLADNTDTSDISGNGRTLTFNGTLTSATSPDLGGGADPIVQARVDGPTYADLAVYDRAPFRTDWFVNAAAIASTLAGSGQSSALSLAAAVQVAQQVASSIGAAVQSSASASASLQVPVQQARSSALTLDLAVRAARTAVADLQAAVQTARTSPAAVDMAVSRALAASASLDLAVRAAGSSATGLDTLVQAQTAVAAGLNLQVQAGTSISSGLQAAVLEARSAAAVLMAVVQLAGNAASAVQAAVQSARAVGVSLDMQVQAGTSTSASIDTAIRVAAAAASSLQAAVQQSRASTASLSAALAVQLTISAAMDAVVLRQLSIAFAMGAMVLIEGQELVPVDVFQVLTSRPIQVVATVTPPIERVGTR